MEFLKIVRLQENMYEGRDLWAPFPGYSVFGGQIAALSLLSAHETVDSDTKPLSITILFVNRCLQDKSCAFAVKRLRDGKTIQMRQVDCYQGTTLVSTMYASFSRPDENAHDYRPKPYEFYADEFTSFSEYIYKALSVDGGSETETTLKYQILYQNLQMMLDALELDVGKEKGNMRQLRIRLKREVTECKYKAGITTLISDLLLVESALITANITLFSSELSLLTSVDHSINFIDLDKPFSPVLYYVVECIAVKDSKATCEGKLVHEDGSLICTTRQQGIFRIRR
jgi:acyl-CoA thioesterase II